MTELIAKTLQHKIQSKEEFSYELLVGDVGFEPTTPCSQSRPYSGSPLTHSQLLECIDRYRNGTSINTLSKETGIHNHRLKGILAPYVTLRTKGSYLQRGGKRRPTFVAHRVRRALRSGKLTNPHVCSKCGESPLDKNGKSLIHGHHDDYNKPLEVRWLCRRCHFEWHKHNTPVEWGSL